ncbi:DUF63 family protein [Halorhabdus amylolytica]|uniref:DUF63 family protein n=1 Tax=Halorhabdus amylolytica TaxID=2559573 RepID=UPI0010AB1CF8|nr:DUF63 family protein [Halorhabdus amylolytica]
MDSRAVTDNPERAWLATFAAGIVAVVGGSIAFTRTVWDGFIWQYFWGPVYADAHKAACAIKDGGLSLENSQTACVAAERGGAIVAEPGYTIVSEVGYMVVGLFFVIGVYLLLRRLDIGLDRSMFFALVPFMLFGGALRVVEDATDAAASVGVEPAIDYPLNTLFISPVIYFTVFGVALASLLASVELANRGVVVSAERTLGYVGVTVLSITIGYLGFLGFTVEYVGFYPQVVILTLGLATLFAYGVYAAADRVAPSINNGTGAVGLVVLWGQAVDGVANVLISDWAGAIGLPISYSPKHPANAFIIDVTQTILPAGILEATGASWPFLLVKLAFPLAIVWLFSEEFIEEQPGYSYLLLVAVVAVGLGPGSRDMLRAALGI